MKNTTIKILCFLLFTILSADVYSQLIPPTRAGDDGHGVCWDKYSHFTYCHKFDLPISYLTFGPIPDKDGCYPVNNFGCNLHIGFTFGEDGPATYIPITNCIVEEIRDAYTIDPVYGEYIGDFPRICVDVPIGNGEDICDLELEYSLDLFCLDENGEFTPISEIASSDPDNNWDEVFPGKDKYSVIEAESWVNKICCEDPEPYTPSGPGPEPTQIPQIGQNGDGSTARVSNLKDVNNVSISVFDANYQSINVSQNIQIVSSSECSIDLSNLNQGVYFVRVVEDGMIYSNTIIKL